MLGPPDIERRVGLTGGHIFQGECMPDQMWAGALRVAHRRCPASTSAAPRRIPPAASSRSTAATPPWPSSPTSTEVAPRAAVSGSGGVVSWSGIGA